MKKLSKIMTTIALIIGAIALVFVGIMWAKGDAAIVANTENVHSYTLEPLFIMTYALMGISCISIIGFVIYNWIKNPQSLLSSLIYIGAFVLIILVGFLLKDSTPVVLSGGKVSTAADASLADFGIIVTYILGGLAVLAVIVGGIYKSSR